MTRRLSRLLFLLPALPLSTAYSADKITYDTHVKPLLREHCFACHNQDDATASLALDTFEGLTGGGAGGEVVSAGDPDSSRLWKLVTHQEEPKMPPGDKLPQGQLDTLKAWIEGGLLKDAGSKPIQRKKPAIATIDASKLGKPVGEPAMPAELLHEPVLWTANPGPVEALATSPWAPLVAIGWQRQVALYHSQNHELLGIIPYVDGVPKVVRFSRDGSLLLVAGGRHAAAGSASLLDVKTGARLATLGDELDIVLAADVSPDLSLVALGGPKKRVKVYRVADGELQYQITKHTEWITALAFSPDGKFLATADRNGGALVWQAAAGHERADLRGHKGTITSLDWRADSATLASASEDGTVKLWSPAGKQIKSINANKGGVLSVRFAQNGNFVTTGRDMHVRTWKPDGAAIADLGKMSGMTLAAAFSHDSKQVFASDYAGEVRLINLATKKEVVQLEPNPQTLSQLFASAEKSLQQAQQQVATSEKQVKERAARIVEGKSAHAAHAAKLAEASTKLTDCRKQYDEALTFFESQQQQHDALRQASELSEAQLADAKSQLALAVASSVDEPAEASKVAQLQQKLGAAQAAFDTANQAADQAKQKLQSATEKRDSGQQRLQAAEELLAQVTNETAGLPDLKKLEEAQEQATSELSAKQKELEQAESKKAEIVAKQNRFTQAMAGLAKQIESRQAEQQELAKTTGRLEAQHSQAASDLSNHSAKLSAIAKQLQDLQAQLTELQSAESKLQTAESALATELREAQTKLANSQQVAELLRQRQQDLEAAQKIREKYSGKQ